MFRKLCANVYGINSINTRLIVSTIIITLPKVYNIVFLVLKLKHFNKFIYLNNRLQNRMLLYFLCWMLELSKQLANRKMHYMRPRLEKKSTDDFYSLECNYIQDALLISIFLMIFTRSA